MLNIGGIDHYQTWQQKRYKDLDNPIENVSDSNKKRSIK